jgi:uroporphyrin-III C-methyltransferase
VFGRGGEEAEALRSEGVGVEVVPGITSAIAGPAAAGIPVTMRGHASGFTVITGHQDPTNAHSIDWEAAARLGTTLIVLMGASRADLIAERLLLGGLDADTPVAVVESATMPDQQVVRTVLADLPGTPVHAPAILVIGSVAGLDVTDAGLEDLVATTAHAASEHGGSSWLN